FLRKVLAQYQRLAADAGGDSEAARAAKANGLCRAAAIRHRLGEIAEAGAAGRDAVALYRQLAADFPDRPQYRRRLAVALNARGRTGEAPGAAADRLRLAGTEQNCAWLLIRTGDLAEAERLLRSALAAHADLRTAEAGSAAERESMALGLSNLGDVCHRAGRH